MLLSSFRRFSSTPRFYFLVALAAALVVIGARWQLIDHAASPVPYLDQWYGEGLVLYRPALQGSLSLHNFLQPHNGHRIVPSRLLAAELLRVNGQWDVRLQMTVNALLAAAICFPLLALARRWLPPVLLVALAGLVAAFYTLPVVYENALWGFQSCFYFLVLFSLLQICLLLLRPALSLGWWLGLACGLAAAVSMGSGLLSSAVIAGVMAWRALREPGSRREFALTATAAAATALLAAWWMPPDLNEYLGAQETHLAATLHTIIHALAFPQRDYSFVGAIHWLPFVVFVATAAFRRTSTPATRALLATGGWVLLQLAAIGYARPETGPVLANRYYEVLAIGLFANLVAWAALWRLAHLGSRLLAWRLVFTILLLGWLGFVSHGTLATARINREQIVEAVIRPVGREQVERVSAFLHTDDPRFLEESSRLALPFPDLPALIGFLRVPELRAIMPFQLHTPINLRFPDVAGQPSLNNAVPITLPNEPGKLHRGTFFRDLGAAGLIAAVSAPAAKSPNAHLIFKVAGDLRAGETELRIRDGQGRTVATITDLHSDVLQPVEVNLPGPTFSVEVVDRSPQRWLAFVEPVEVGPLSHATLVALRHGTQLFSWGAAALGLLFLLAAMSLRRPGSDLAENS